MSRPCRSRPVPRRRPEREAWRQMSSLPTCQPLGFEPLGARLAALDVLNVRAERLVPHRPVRLVHGVDGAALPAPPPHGRATHEQQHRRRAPPAGLGVCELASGARYLDVGVRQHELADLRVQREDLHARAQREREEGGRRVEAVAGGHQRGARLQRRREALRRSRGPSVGEQQSTQPLRPCRWRLGRGLLLLASGRELPRSSGV